MTTAKSTIDMLAKVAVETEDLRLLQDIRRMQRRLAAVSMSEILDRVPGDSVTDKAKFLRITRTTYYSWLNGFTRPRGRSTVSKLSKITGYGIDEIRGE